MGIDQAGQQGPACSVYAPGVFVFCEYFSIAGSDDFAIVVKNQRRKLPHASIARCISVNVVYGRCGIRTVRQKRDDQPNENSGMLSHCHSITLSRSLCAGDGWLL